MYILKIINRKILTSLGNTLECMFNSIAGVLLEEFYSFAFSSHSFIKPSKCGSSTFKTTFFSESYFRIFLQTFLNLIIFQNFNNLSKKITVCSTSEQDKLSVAFKTDIVSLQEVLNNGTLFTVPLI